MAGDLVRSGSRVTVHDQGKWLNELSGEAHERIGARLRHLYDPYRLARGGPRRHVATTVPRAVMPASAAG